MLNLVVKTAIGCFLSTNFSEMEIGTNITVRACTLAELERATDSELANFYSWLKANMLSLNIARTELW